MAIAESLDIDEITTQSMIARNDSDGHLERSERSQSYEILPLPMRSRKTDTLTLTSSARAPQNDFNKKLNCCRLMRGVVARTSYKVAFTLAEVLITLGIIGIVITMTIPSLVNEYKKKEVETRLAHTYSTMTQIFKLAEADNGESQYWTKNIAGSPNISDLTIVDGFLNIYFIPYLNFNTKIETIDGYGLTKYGYDIRYFNGYQMEGMRITRLNNGVILFWGMFIGRQGICALHIIADINGKKGPNRIGSDLFDMTYSLYDGELFMSGEKNIDGYRLTYSKKQNYQQLLENCQRTITPDYFAPNYSCGAVIKINGWKIPKDYPIRL